MGPAALCLRMIHTLLRSRCDAEGGSWSSSFALGALGWLLACAAQVVLGYSLKRAAHAYVARQAAQAGGRTLPRAIAVAAGAAAASSKLAHAGGGGAGVHVGTAGVSMSTVAPRPQTATPAAASNGWHHNNHSAVASDAELAALTSAAVADQRQGATASAHRATASDAAGAQQIGAHSLKKMLQTAVTAVPVGRPAAATAAAAHASDGGRGTTYAPAHTAPGLVHRSGGSARSPTRGEQGVVLRVAHTASSGN